MPLVCLNVEAWLLVLSSHALNSVIPFTTMLPGICCVLLVVVRTSPTYFYIRLPYYSDWKNATTEESYLFVYWLPLSAEVFNELVCTWKHWFNQSYHFVWQHTDDAGFVVFLLMDVTSVQMLWCSGSTDKIHSCYVNTQVQIGGERRQTESAPS